MIAKCESNISEHVLEYVRSGKHERNEALSHEEIKILSLRVCMRESFKKIAAAMKRSVSTIQRILVTAAEKLGIYLKEHAEEDEDWTNVSNTPPPEDKLVLVARYDEKAQDYCIQIALRIGENWFDDKDGHLIDPKLGVMSYWKELPKKPKK